MAEVGPTDFPCLVWPHSFTILLFLVRLDSTRSDGKKGFKPHSAVLSSQPVPVFETQESLFTMLCCKCPLVIRKQKSFSAHVLMDTDGGTVCLMLLKGQALPKLYRPLSHYAIPLNHFGSNSPQARVIIFLRVAFHQHSQNWPHKFPFSVYKSSSK